MKKMAVLMGLMIAILAVLPYANADLIDPSQKEVVLRNVIVNINDYSEKNFISICDLGGTYSDPKIVPEDGIIGEHYKMCSIDVYALDKVYVIDQSELDNFLLSQNSSDIRVFLESKNANLVIQGAPAKLTVPKTSPIEERVNSYEVSMDKIVTRPLEAKEVRDWSYIAYTILPLVALILIIFWIVRRKMKASVESSE